MLNHDNSILSSYQTFLKFNSCTAMAINFNYLKYGTPKTCSGARCVKPIIMTKMCDFLQLKLYVYVYVNFYSF